jgi:DNA-binding MarR family transcriptional regulator
MPTPSVKTARALLEVTTLLMRSLAARMRQGQQRLEPAHIGILAKVSLGSCTLTELAQHQSVRLPTMSKSVALLVERGWLERTTPPDNRRLTMVSLTAEGRQAFAEMKRDAEKHVALMLATLDGAERKRVERGLATLVRVLSPADRNERG